MQPAAAQVIFSRTHPPPHSVACSPVSNPVAFTFEALASTHSLTSAEARIMGRQGRRRGSSMFARLRKPETFGSTFLPPSIAKALGVVEPTWLHVVLVVSLAG